ncbi:MAG: hypothetical protein V4757_13925 [Pseudomonadota bacterium]
MIELRFALAIAVLVAPLYSLAQPKAGICWIKHVRAEGTSAVVTFNDGLHIQGYAAAVTDQFKPLFHFRIGGADSDRSSLEVAAGVIANIRGGPHSSCVLQTDSRLGTLGLLVKATESGTPSPPYFHTVEQFIPLN